MLREKTIRKHLIFSGRVQGLGRQGRDGGSGKTGRNRKINLHAVSAEIYLDRRY